MSLAGNIVSFNNLEKEIYQECCKLGRQAFAEILEKYDQELSRNRDKSIYRDKGKRKTTVKTIMGEVTFKRNVYEKNEDGTKEHVYLLDEAVGLKRTGLFSGMLVNLISKSCCESTYREAAREVSECTGQNLSHTAAWNVVQDVGKRLDKVHQKHNGSIVVQDIVREQLLIP